MSRRLEAGGSCQQSVVSGLTSFGQVLSLAELKAAGIEAYLAKRSNIATV